MNKNRTSNFVTGTSASGLVLLVLALAQPAARAATYNYQLPDGLLVLLDAQPGQTVITLTGLPNAPYQIQATELFNGWTTLTNATLGAGGTFVYTDTSNLPKCFYRVVCPVTFTSVGAQDGRVTEYPETSNTGAFAFATESNADALRAGDYDFDLQHKTFLSFNTASLPDGATIVGATVRLRRGTVVGTNPFTTHGTCFIDIKGGTGFGGATNLATGDFQAAADATQVGVLSNAPNNGDWSSGALNVTGLSFINKTGTTQLRIYFSLDDNDDGASDYIGWYSGENATPVNRPVLEILYY